MGKDTLQSNLNYTRVTCEYARKINKAAQIANKKAMFRASDVRRARKELAEQEQGYEIVD